MPTGDRLAEEPDAGNPHVRFNEGEQGVRSTSCSLLYRDPFLDFDTHVVCNGRGLLYFCATTILSVR